MVVHLGLEGLGVFVFLVFVVLFCLAFVSVLFALFLVLWLDVVVVFFVCFFFVFVCFCLFFLGGFKGHVRWPKGPPHLALNPPYFICFCFFLLFVFHVFSLSLLLLEKNPVFPPKKGIFVYFFCVSLCFSLALFQFLLFLCLSLFFFLVSFLYIFVISVSGSCFFFLFCLLSLFFGFCCSACRLALF